jgi:hypothetical protein
MKTMLIKKNLSVVVISTSVLLVTMNSQAEIYKWTDAKGVIHYSAQKPVQQTIKSENIEDEIRSAAGKYRASSRQVPQTPAQTTTKSKNIKTKTQLSGPSAKLVSYCKTQRKNLAQLKKNYRNIWKDKGGKTSRLNQKQRQQKVNKIQKSITTECAGV